MLTQPRAAPTAEARDPQRRQRGEAPDLGGEVHPQKQDEPRGGRRHAERHPAHRVDHQADDEQHRQQRRDQHEAQHERRDRAQPSQDGLRPGLIDASLLHAAILGDPGRRPLAWHR